MTVTRTSTAVLSGSQNALSACTGLAQGARLNPRCTGREVETSSLGAARETETYGFP